MAVLKVTIVASLLQVVTLAADIVTGPIIRHKNSAVKKRQRERRYSRVVDDVQDKDGPRKSRILDEPLEDLSVRRGNDDRSLISDSVDTSNTEAELFPTSTIQIKAKTNPVDAFTMRYKSNPPLPPPPADNQDGKSMKPRIVGGSASSPGRYPYMASLSEQGMHVCGGTLIAPDCILTAAHCFDAFGEIQLGRYNRTDVSEKYESYVVETTAIHPDFVDNESLITYDFMIVKFFGRTEMQPVRLNRDDDDPSTPGAQLTVIGWGVTMEDDSRPGGVLQRATVDYFLNDDCEASSGYVGGSYGSYQGLIDESMMCAADSGQDSCQGDSGGPLLFVDRYGDPDNDLQAGVVSWGYGCADSDFPGVYSRVSHVKNWIDSVVCQLSHDPPTDFRCAPPAPTPTPSPSPQIAVVVEIGLDNYPGETGYIITSKMDNGVTRTYASRPIWSYIDENKFSIVNEVILLDNHREYVFTMLDKFGDGSCCAGGNGYFRVYEQNSGDELVPEQGVFAHSKSITFTIGNAPAVSPSPPTMDESFAPTETPQYAPPHLFVFIKLDNYPHETYWRLEYRFDDWDEDDWETLTWSGFFSYLGLPGKVIGYDIELFGRDDGNVTYNFAIHDLEEDGICCSYGAGYYQLFLGTVDEENLIYQGGEFEDFDMVEFSVTFEESSLEQKISTLAPSPSVTPMTSAAYVRTSATSWKWIFIIGMITCYLYVR